MTHWLSHNARLNDLVSVSVAAEIITQDTNARCRHKSVIKILEKLIDFDGVYCAYMYVSVHAYVSTTTKIIAIKVVAIATISARRLFSHINLYNFFNDSTFVAVAFSTFAHIWRTLKSASASLKWRPLQHMAKCHRATAARRWAGRWSAYAISGWCDSKIRVVVVVSGRIAKVALIECHLAIHSFARSPKIFIF